MTALPVSTDFTDSGITEAQFKTAITNQRDYLSGLFGSTGNAIDALATLGTLGSSTTSKSSAYTVVATDMGAILDCSSTFTLSLTASATLGEGFIFAVVNNGSGVITIDPNSTELIDGASTKDIESGSWAIVSCSGTSFSTLGSTPANGALIGFQTFTTSGIYSKSLNNPSFVIVEVVGGGASGVYPFLGAGVNGGTSSFGTHCSATGGVSGGSGGAGSGGDLNVSGARGSTSAPTAGSLVAGGYSKFGGVIGLGGSGGAYTSGGLSYSSGSSGGGGGYAMKKILTSALSSSETITVGAGGNSTTAPDGNNGIVIVWEYK